MKTMKDILHQYYGLKDAQISLVHEEEAIPYIQALIAMSKFEMIVEFGTSWGGFTLVLHEASPESIIHTFDNDNSRNVNYGWFERNTSNILFYKPVDLLKKPHKVVVELLENPKYKLLYCDNGNKPKEIEMYAKYLNSGDVIGVHDYGYEYEEEEVDKHLEKFIWEPYYHEILSDWSTRFWRKK